MKSIIIISICCLILCGCETLEEIRDNPVLEKISSFELTPTAPNSYWENEGDDGDDSYDYNQYEIKITAEPDRAKIRWNGTQIGVTPLTYKFTGVLYENERITLEAVPFDRERRIRKKRLSCNYPLPRTIHFKLGEK